MVLPVIRKPKNGKLAVQRIALKSKTQGNYNKKCEQADTRLGYRVLAMEQKFYSRMTPPPPAPPFCCWSMQLLYEYAFVSTPSNIKTTMAHENCPAFTI
jgi:hypothetical protein